MQRSADGQAKLIFSVGVEHDTEEAPKTSADVGKAEVVHLALRMDFDRGKGRCGYSLDGKISRPSATSFAPVRLADGDFQGEQYAVFCYNPKPSDGYLDVDSVHFEKYSWRRRPVEGKNGVLASPRTAGGLPVGRRPAHHPQCGTHAS